MVRRKYVIYWAILISNLVERGIYVLLWIFAVNFSLVPFKHAPAGKNAHDVIDVTYIMNFIMYFGILIITIIGISKCVRDLKKWDQP